MASKNLDVGVKYTGDAKDFKQANNEARKEAARLRREAVAHSKEMERKFKDVTMAIAKIGAAAIVAQKAFRLVEKGMAQTGEGVGRLFELTTQVNKGFETFAGLLVSGNFTNGIEKIRDAVQAAKELAEAMDMANDRLEALDVYKAATGSKVKMLRVKEAEGTITKSEQAMLKMLLQEQLRIEEDIYEKRTTAYLDFITERNSLSKGLFEDIETGIIDIAKTEEAALESITKNALASYKKFRDQFISDNTKLQTFQPSGDAMPVTVTTPPSAAAVGSAMSSYLGGLGAMEQAILVREMLSNDDEWKGLLANMVQRNTLEGEYARALRITSKQIKEGGTGTPIQRETGIAIQGGAAMPGSLSQVEDMNKLSEMMTIAYEKAYDLNAISMTLQGTFENMFSAGMEGWDEFGKAAVNAIKQMLVKLAALAATYAVLSLLPGFAAFMEAVGGFSGFVRQGMGFGSVTNAVKTSPVAAGGGSVLKGRDIVLSAERSGGVIYKNT